MRHREGERPVGGYKLISFLGEGGYGEVWKATAPGGLPCALKFIKLDSNAGLKELKSIGLVKKLRHPNLVPLSAVWLRDEDGNTISEGDNGESFSFRVSGDKELVIAMGLGSGSLADKLAAARSEKAVDALPGGLSLRKLLGYMQDAARGIDCLNNPTEHGNPDCQPLAHCDIKPANLLLVGGCVQVCDYGVAKAVGKDIKKTMAAGTAAYAPPELINNDPGLKSDQYSLAISYYELRTGHLPLDENKALMAHLMGQLDFSRVPAEERDVLQQATAIKVADRFPTCEEFVEALHIASGRTVSGTGVYAPQLRKPQPDTADEIELSAVPPPPPPKPRPTSDVLRPHGDPIAGYKLEKMLGQGGYGQVWQATDEDGVACALKVLRDVQGKGRHEYDTLKRLRKLDHPNLLRIEELWVLDEYWAPIPRDQIGLPGSREARRMVIRTPLADKNLFQKLTECRRHSQPGIPPAELLRYLRQAADALDYLNIDQQIQHRDVKPENLLLKGEVLWVSDFGLAKVVPSGGVTAQSTSSGMTQEYVSPEVLTNKQITDRSDQYSLAVTYHVLRTGRLPFPPGLSMYDLIQARATGSLDLTELSDAERPVLRRSLSAHPGDRYPTCRELLRELAHALDQTTKQQPAAVAPLPLPPRTGSAPVLLATPAAADPPSSRRTPAVHTTLEFPTTETKVKFEADPFEPEPTSEWKSGPKAKPSGARTPGFKQEEEKGAGKLVLAGLAAVAVAAAGFGGWYKLAGPGAASVASSGDTPPTVPTPPSGDPPPPPKRTPEVVAADAERLIQDKNLAGLEKLDGPGAAEWKSAWRPLLADPQPATADGLKTLAKAFTDAPVRLPAQYSESVLTRRRKALTDLFEKAGPSLDFGRDGPTVAEALAAADPSNPNVAMWLTEATGTPPDGANLPDGFAKYASAATAPKPRAADVAAAVPADPPPGWLTPRRAGVLADRLATAVVAARRAYPGDFPDPAKADAWLTAFERMAAAAPTDVAATARKMVAADAVVLAQKRPALAARVGWARPLVRPADLARVPEDIQKDILGGPELARVKAVRALLTADQTPAVLAAEVYPKLARPDDLIGTGAGEVAKSALADLCRDAGRRLFRDRDVAAGRAVPPDLQAVHRQAADLFGHAHRLGRQADDADRRAVLNHWADPTRPLAVATGSGVPGRLLAALTAHRKAAEVAAQDATARQYAAVIADAEADPEAHRVELVVACYEAAKLAVGVANNDALRTRPDRRRELLRSAIAWGNRHAELEPDRVDGPDHAACAWEDIGWLLREPLGKAERCGDGPAPTRPYAKAEELFAQAEGRKYGDKGMVKLNRGRNLFKWAEDFAQLGKWKDQDAPARPPAAKLDTAETLLAEAARLRPSSAPEARHWLGEVAFVRYQAAVAAVSSGEPDELAEKALQAHELVARTKGDGSAAWQSLSAARVAGLRPAVAASRLVAGRRKVTDALADNRTADAIAAARVLVEGGKTADLPPDDRAADIGLLARAHLAAGEDKVATKPAQWAAARTVLGDALRAGGGPADRLRWRYDLGRIEQWFGDEEQRGATDQKPAAADHYALATHHLLDAFHLYNRFGRAQPVANVYAQVGTQLGDLLKKNLAYFAKVQDSDSPPDARFAFRRLIATDIRLNQRPDDEFKNPASRREEWKLLRANAGRYAESVTALGKPGDEDYVRAAAEVLTRIDLYGR